MTIDVREHIRSMLPGIADEEVEELIRVGDDLAAAGVGDVFLMVSTLAQFWRKDSLKALVTREAA